MLGLFSLLIFFYFFSYYSNFFLQHLKAINVTYKILRKPQTLLFQLQTTVYVTDLNNSVP